MATEYAQPKANILIVDDYEPNLLALQAVLNSPKYLITAATSGAEALELCEKTNFALILLDIQMPLMDGFEVARRIKEIPRNREVPIIFITAVYQADPFVKRGFDAGAIDYFGKPFEPDILKAKVGIYTELYLKTKRLEETEQLLKTHDQIKTLLDAIPIGVIVADLDGNIYEHNSEAERIWCGIKQCSLENFNQYKGWWAGSGKQLESHDWAIVRALTTGEASKDEMIEIESFDGTKKTILSSGYPIKGKSGQILGAVSIIQDITVQREVADDIHRKVADLLKDAQILKADTAPH